MNTKKNGHWVAIGLLVPLLGACVAAQSFDGETPDYSGRVEINVTDAATVMAKCGEWGIPLAAGCACMEDPQVGAGSQSHPQRQSLPPGNPCELPRGVKCVIWSTRDARTVTHELGHCFTGLWH